MMTMVGRRLRAWRAADGPIQSVERLLQHLLQRAGRKPMKGSTAGRWRTTCALVALTIAVATGPSHGAPARHWVGTWTASPAPPDSPALAVTNRTIRQIVHTSIGGSRLRLRLANTFGVEPLRIDAVAVASIDPDDAAAGAARSRTASFGGLPAITIPPGARVVSDPIEMRLPPGGHVMVSFYAAGTTGPLTWHRFASATTWISFPGDHVADATMDAFPFRRSSFYVLDGIEVSAPRHVGAIVTLGDSITDGVGSSIDGNGRYPDFLARRLRRRGRRVGVLNAGIGSNRILNDSGSGGVNALARFDRDVLAQSGVHTVIVLEGINDIGFSQVPLDVCPTCFDVSVEEITAGYEQLVAQAHRHGLRVIGATLLPFEGAYYYSPPADAKRQAVNEWIRHRSPFDGIIDFDVVMHDPDDRLRMRAAYDSGDHLHPGDAGFEAMAAAIDLRCLRRTRSSIRRRGARKSCTLRRPTPRTAAAAAPDP
jgi:lysophospholipase L1-like esterase